MTASVNVWLTRLDPADWDEWVVDREDAYELVEGVPKMAPAETVFDRTVATTLGWPFTVGAMGGRAPRTSA